MIQVDGPTGVILDFRLSEHARVQEEAKRRECALTSYLASCRDGRSSVDYREILVVEYFDNDW